MMRSEGGILGALTDNRPASEEETVGVQEEREKGCKRGGRSIHRGGLPGAKSRDSFEKERAVHAQWSCHVG